ncbi:MAG: Ribonuclease Y [Phycisphaerae bacterium]|nr:Ribonuclease Y [Phycisphaerae bacterium]
MLAVTGAVTAVIAVVAVVAGAGVAVAMLRLLGRAQLQAARRDADHLIEQAEKEAEGKRRQGEIDAKAEMIHMREGFETESAKTREEFRETERRLTKREDNLEKKMEMLTVKERSLDARGQKLKQQEDGIADKEAEAEKLLTEQKNNLLRITGMNPEQAKELLLVRLEEEVQHECSALVERLVGEAKEQAKEKSRMIVLQAIQRYAAEHTCDTTVSSVEIPSDDMKGRVIGREGRNIRAFEKATGCDVIVDDTPGVVIVSGFDPIRREVARRSLEKLVGDGRIHPARIEEVVAATAKEIEERVVELGKKATMDANLRGLNPKLQNMLGRLSFRTSYGQNVLRHSLEVGYLCQVMAEELGLDGDLARRCGVLHDIGKAADHETEGSHPEIGAELCRRYKEPDQVINAVEGHHGDVEPTSPYTPLVAAADAVSAVRPGARRESLERYIKRLEKLEEVATSFEGVRQAYAIQAGREVRVIVDAQNMDDKSTYRTARQLAKRIEKELTYPGEVKVTLIREVRAVEYAR